MLPVTFTQVKVLIKNSLQPLNVHWESFHLKVIIYWIEGAVDYREGQKKKEHFPFVRTLTGQTILVIMRISLFIKTIQPDQSNPN